MKRDADLLFDALTIRISSGVSVMTGELSRLMAASHCCGIKFVYSDGDRRIGYYVLARLNSETIKIVKKGAAFLQYAYEADEGKIVVIYDFVVDSLFHQEAMLAFKAELAKYRFFCVYRRGVMRLYRRLNNKLVRVKF